MSIACLVAGVTGATGREIAHILAANPRVSKLVLLTRRANPYDGLLQSMLNKHFVL